MPEIGRSQIIVMEPIASRAIRLIIAPARNARMFPCFPSGSMSLITIYSRAPIANEKSKWYTDFIGERRKANSTPATGERERMRA